MRMFDMMGKLTEAKKKAEAAKEKLNTISVAGTAANGSIRIIATGNREIKDVQLSEAVESMDREELQDQLVIAMNDALKKASEIQEQEMKAAAQDVLPNLPGMGNLFS